MSAAPELLQTPRLRLERLVPDHQPDMIALLRDPRVSAWLTDDGSPPSAETVRRQHAEKIAHWLRFGFGLWAARERTSGSVVGRGGLQHAFAKGIDDIELAWTFAPEVWGRGLATELAAAACEVGLQTMGLPRVVALTTPENAASRRVMEKAGLRFECTLRDVEPPLVLYVLSR